MATIRQPLDFAGVSLDSAERVRAGPASPEVLPRAPGCPRTATDQVVEPDCLYWGPRFLYERYRLPICVTGNGADGRDWLGQDSRVRDPQRIEYIRRHLRALERVSAHGVDVCGYFYRSLLDGFEGIEGFNKRSGLVHVDRETLGRTPKDSARWYREVIATHGASLRAIGG